MVIGNPPYNVGQQNENDNNKNRTYPIVDQQIKETYIKDSTATKTKAYDSYIRFFRWATDRLKRKDGIVCFVTNNGFVKKNSLDGMRKHLLKDFDQIYHLDLHGDVRENPKLSGTTHNVFGIQVGVGITIAIRKAGAEKFLKYHRVAEDWTKLQKLSYIRSADSLSKVQWETLEPDAKGNWITEGMHDEFETFLPIGTKEAKAGQSHNAHAIFHTFCPGVNSGRDTIAYDYSKLNLENEVQTFLKYYNLEVDRYISSGKPKDIDSFVTYVDSIKWSRNLKSELTRVKKHSFSENDICTSMYRAFSKRWLYRGEVVNDEIGSLDKYFINGYKNIGIVLSATSHRAPFSCLTVDSTPDYHLLASSDGFQCFPMYVYDIDGKNKRDNVTDWALEQFQNAYGPTVTKSDIFYYVYALLHHPEYRTRYAENLKRELPRIPLLGPHPALFQALSSLSVVVGEGSDYSDSPFSNTTHSGLGEGAGGMGVFQALVDIGQNLATLHLNYETAAEYPLGQVVNKNVPFQWRVTKMKLSKDRTELMVNDALTFTGIPPETFDYKLGSRSALDWIIDQYQVSKDKRTGMTSDPNRTDDPEYIARLVRRIVTVSVETVKLIQRLENQVQWSESIPATEK